MNLIDIEWIPVIIAGTSLLSAVFVTFINNFWTHRLEKQKHSHEINIKKSQLFQEAKTQAINDFMIAVGKCIAFTDEEDSRLELYANCAKVLPYLNENTVTIVSELVFQRKCKNEEILIELAKSLHTNDIKN